MQVSVEQISELGRKLTITVPSDKINTKVAERLNKLKSSVKMDGFRPGKVPLNVVKQRYGAQVQQEVMSDEMQGAYQEAVLQEKLRPASAPRFEVENVVKDQDLKFAALFDIFPEFELCDLTTLDIEVPTSEVGDKEIDETLDGMRKQRMNWTETDVASEKGHRITINFVGKMDGEEFEGGKAEDFPLILGEGGMIDGFEDELIGLQAGNDKSFTVTFPEDYGNKELAGKEATFDTQVKKVELGELPEVNDEFIQSYGVDGTIDALKDEIRKSLEHELDKNIKATVKSQLMETLSANNELTLPETMVQQEVAALREQAQQNFQMETSADLPDSLFEEEAKRRVKIGLIIGEIVKTENLQLDRQQVNTEIQQMAVQYADPQQVLDYYQNNNQARAQVESVVMENQVVDFILSKAKVTEKKAPFESIVKARR